MLGKGENSPATPNAVDIHVGGRVRLRRLLLGMSQEELGDALGVTFQQVQKYERGANRIGAGRLYDVARALNVPIEYFFEGLEGEPAPSSKGARSEGHDARAAIDAFIASPIGLRIARGFARIEDPAVREKIAALVALFAEKEQDR